MNSKHKKVPWYGASEELQAKLTLKAMTASGSEEVAVSQQEIVVPTVPIQETPAPTPTPAPFSSFTASAPPSEEDIKEAAMFAPSDLQQYDYAINCRSGIISRYPKGPDQATQLTA